MHFRVRVLMCALLSGACADPTAVQETQAHAQAAENALGRLILRRDGLKQGREALRVKVASARRDLEAARTNTARLQAAMALAETEAVDPQARTALEAWQLEHARDDGERAAHATRILAAHAPCDAPQGCAMTPPSLCDDASVRPVRPEWTCEPRARSSVCGAQVDLPGSSTWSTAGLPTRQALTRVVRVVDGVVHAADWPPPEPELYLPRDDDKQTSCEREQAVLRCRMDCLSRQDVRSDMCSLTTGSAEIRDACAARCGPRKTPAPTGHVEVTSRLHSEPAPGVYVLEVDEQFFDASGEAQGVRTLTRLLADPWQEPGSSVDKDESLTSLTLVAEAEDARGKHVDALPEAGVPRGAGWMRVPGVDGEVLIMPNEGNRGLRGHAFSKRPGEPPIKTLPSDVICRQQQAFPEAWKDAWVILCKSGGKP